MVSWRGQCLANEELIRFQEMVIHRRGCNYNVRLLVPAVWSSADYCLEPLRSQHTSFYQTSHEQLLGLLRRNASLLCGDLTRISVKMTGSIANPKLSDMGLSLQLLTSKCGYW